VHHQGRKRVKQVRSLRVAFMNPILAHLRRHPSIVPYSLADLAHVTRQSPTAVQLACEELEAAGLLRREEDGWVGVKVVEAEERMLF
jgi:DNA-binding IclR family transcriptional regulator